MWALVIAAIVLVVVLIAWSTGDDRRAPREAANAQPGTRARGILDARYARGELAADEYHERRRNVETD